LVISAIVNVAQNNVEEDWVLEVIGHQGVAVNLTLAPGEMILYESHSVIHGRPYPLRGKYYANWFFHFEPVGYTRELIKRQGLIAQTKTPKSNKDLFHAALEKTKVPDHNKQDDEPLDNNNSQKQQQQPAARARKEEETKQQQKRSSSIRLAVLYCRRNTRSDTVATRICLSAATFAAQTAIATHVIPTTRAIGDERYYWH
jgi:hypothetical protein